MKATSVKRNKGSAFQLRCAICQHHALGEVWPPAKPVNSWCILRTCRITNMVKSKRRKPSLGVNLAKLPIWLSQWQKAWPVQVIWTRQACGGQFKSTLKISLCKIPSWCAVTHANRPKRDLLAYLTAKRILTEQQNRAVPLEVRPVSQLWPTAATSSTWDIRDRKRTLQMKCVSMEHWRGDKDKQQRDAGSVILFQWLLPWTMSRIVPTHTFPSLRWSGLVWFDSFGALA